MSAAASEAPGAPALEDLLAAVRAGRPPAEGVVRGVRGAQIQVGLAGAAVGDRLALGDGLLEVVGFEGERATALALTPGLQPRAGDPVRRLGGPPRLPAGPELLGRVVDGLGQPLDGGPPLSPAWPARRRALPPLSRPPVEAPLVTGLRILDGLCPLGRGQRLALEAGPGVGKSTLLAQLAAQAEVDAVVLALVGERGREIGEAVARLSPAARARTVVVAARADDPPLAWLEAASAATALAEGFRDAGQTVLLLVDSLTRVARAVRQVGLAAGEPTTRRGFTPSLAPTLAGLLERAGNGPTGSVTAVYAVLTEGGGVDDPVAEEARALLDGHWVLDAERAAAGRFPAVSLAQSVSRCEAGLCGPAQRAAQATLRRRLAVLERHRDLLAVGAYRPGADPDLDAALEGRAAFEAFCRQGPREATPLTETLAQLVALAR